MAQIKFRSIVIACAGAAIMTSAVPAAAGAAVGAGQGERPTAMASAARISLRLGLTVRRPYLLDVAKVTVSPAGTPYVLQTRRPGTARWYTAAENLGVWARFPGTLEVRAMTRDPALAAQAASSVVSITVGDGKVPAWVRELNYYRAINDAAPVAEYARLSRADALHVRYMIKTGDYSHVENPHSRWYTKAGAEAGVSSDLFLGEPDPINGWARAPYHAMPELSKFGTLAGFAQGGGFAALWVDPDWTVATIQPPYYQFPASGKRTSLRTYYGAEIPNPVSHCRRPRPGGYGLPIIYGNQNPITRPTAALTTRGATLSACIVNAFGQAVFVIPLRPLARHHTFTVTVYYRHKLQSRWTFRTK